jgi:hypothetical protein
MEIGGSWTGSRAKTWLQSMPLVLLPFLTLSLRLLPGNKKDLLMGLDLE